MRNVAVNLTTGGGNADDRSGRGAAVPFCDVRNHEMRQQ